MDRPRLLSIEGNIGAGKSTLVELMKQRYQDREDIIFLQEPVDIWNTIQQNGKTMLELFYENQRKYSFSFQVMAYTTRLEMIRQEVNLAMESGIVKTIVMERSLEADRNIFARMLHDDGMMESCNFDIYKYMSDAGLRQFSVDGIMWIMTDPEECYRRIQVRNREGENNIEEEYLDKCDIYHREWLSADLGFVFYVEKDQYEWDKIDKFLGVE